MVLNYPDALNALKQQLAVFDTQYHQKRSRLAHALESLEQGFQELGGLLEPPVKHASTKTTEPATESVKKSTTSVVQIVREAVSSQKGTFSLKDIQETLDSCLTDSSKKISNTIVSRYLYYLRSTGMIEFVTKSNQGGMHTYRLKK